MGIWDSLLSVLSGMEEPEQERGKSDDWNPQEESPTRTREEATVVVTGTMEISGVGTVVTARITDGVLRKGDSLSFEDGTTAGVETIELHHNEVKKAEEGNVVGLELSGIDASYITEGSRAKSEEGTDGDGSVR